MREQQRYVVVVVVMVAIAVLGIVRDGRVLDVVDDEGDVAADQGDDDNVVVGDVDVGGSIHVEISRSNYYSSDYCC